MADILASGIRDNRITRYSQLSASCIILFDYSITFDNEVNLIWKRKWTWGKALFLINRYYALASAVCLASAIFSNYALFTPVVTDLFCLRYFQWEGWSGVFVNMVAEAVLQMRIYALYCLNKKILVLISTCFIISSSASAWILGRALSSFTAYAYPLPDGPICDPIGLRQYLNMFWVPMLSFESLLCALALYQGFTARRLGGSLFERGRELIGVLVRDSLIYFLVIFATYLSCVVFMVSAPPYLLAVPVVFSFAMPSVLSNRLILNIRETCHKSTHDPSMLPA